MIRKLSILMLAVTALFSASSASAFNVTPGMSGAWYDPSHDGEGYFIQVLNDTKAVAFWFTYDKKGEQYWMVGVGDIKGSKISIPNLNSVHGGKFGPGFDPDDVVRTHWGELEFDFSSCDSATVDYSGPSEFGSGQLNVKRLTSLWGFDCNGNDTTPQSSGQGFLKTGFSGSWFDPTHDGEGFVIEVLNETTAIVIWFTFDTAGNPVWLLDAGEIDGATIIVDGLQITSGGVFGPEFNPDDVVKEHWGAAAFTFGSCGNGGMRYSGPASFGPESTQLLQRLVSIKGAECGFFGSPNKVSGDMNVAENTYIDGDTNDPNTPLIPNNGNGGWQDIFTPAYVAGFVSEKPTGEEGQRFESEPDQGDLYRISLRKGERLSLAIANPDSSNGGGDLDLWLYSSDNSEDPVDSSLGAGSEEIVYAPETGDYFLWVWAQEGKSNYTLRTGWDTTAQTSSLTVNADMVTDQIMVGHLPVAKSNLTAEGSQGKLKYAFDAFDADLQLTRLSSSLDGSALYEINAPYVNMKSAYEFPLAKYGFGLQDHRKWVAVLTAKKLLQESEVQYAGPNYIASTSAVPNDFWYPNQWHYKSIDLESAWDITRGSKDVIVAVIDSGVAPHSDLVSSVAYELGFDFVRNSFLSPSGDGDGIDSDARDPGAGYTSTGYKSHGTHVAGTIGAVSNNGKGVAGVNWNVTIMPIRAGSIDSSLSCSAIIDGLKWAGRLPNSSGTVPAKKADVINMSFGGYADCPGREAVLNQLTDMGVILIAAAGNDTTLRPMYPAALPGVVSVSATNMEDQLAFYSNYGTSVDIAAPGGGVSAGVLSTAAENDPLSSDFLARYSPMRGTSMASPHVAGVAALMKSVYPEMTATDFDYALTSGEITDDLARNGVKVKDNSFGYGRINAHKAVSWALEASNQGQRETFITSSASALDFGSSETGLLIDVGKSGPDSIKAETWYREDEWVSLEAVNTDASAFGTYRVVVNRSGLPRGQYRSTLWLEADNETVTRVSINLQVGESVTGEAGQQYAVLLDAYTLTAQYWWAGKQQSENYNVNFEGVVSGYYYLLVGSDMDGDDFFCDEGEFCRLYPTENGPKLIEVNNGDYSLGNFTMTIPSPKIGASQASAVLVDEDGTVEESSEAFKDFTDRFGQSGWKIQR